MRRSLPLLVALSLASAAVGAVADGASASAIMAGPVTRVVDGDTVRFGATIVRIAGIDAPEMSTAYGPLSRSYLAQLVAGGDLRCEDLGQRSYGRIVAQCFLPGGADVGAAMVDGGWAFDWPTYSRGAYRMLELQARVWRRGIFRRDPAAQREQYHPRGK